MKEGTKSVLFGCHNPMLHGIWVLMAWRLEYKSWPKWWELIGIFLHDIGVWGRQYLSDDKAKIGHWEKGSVWTWKIIYFLTGDGFIALDARDLVAGHCPGESNFPESKLARADKRSWVIAPMWWLWWNYYIEWHNSRHKITLPPVWKKLVAEKLQETKGSFSCHELYIKNRR